MTNANLLESITKMGIEKQNQKLRHFARVDITTKLKILDKQKPIFHQIKTLYIDEDKSVITLASLILAIDREIENHDEISFNAIKMRVKSHKSNVKREKLLDYWAIVKTLKQEQNMSFRDISKYFIKYHRFSVSYSLIYELWNKLENKNTTKDN